jgi:NAD-specific glutamate dehydrogenase
MREAVGRFRPGIAGIMAELETVLGARAAAGLAETAAAYAADGVEGTLARALAASPYLLPSGDIVLVAQTVAGDRAPEAGDHLATARVYFALDTMLGIGWLRERLALVRPRSSWERLALAGLDDELSAVLRRLTVAAQGAAVAGRSVEEAEAGVEGYLASGVHGFDRYRRLKEQLATVERLDLAGLSVATRALGSLVPGG